MFSLTPSATRFYAAASRWLMALAMLWVLVAVLAPGQSRANPDYTPVFVTEEGLTRLVLNMPEMPLYSLDRGADDGVLRVDFRYGLAMPNQAVGRGAGAVQEYRWVARPDGVWRLELTGYGPLTVATVFAEPLVDIAGHRFVLELSGAPAPATATTPQNPAPPPPPKGGTPFGSVLCQPPGPKNPP
ncbi:MAG: hypothetical protein AAF213_07390, partial [Pseudomonadota bacterium]